MRINFDMKFYKANMTGFARLQLVKTVNHRLMTDNTADIILFFRRQFNIQ